MQAGEREQSAVEEAAILGRVAEGDFGEPVSQLYERYGDPLYRFGMRLLGDASLAEELVQESLVRLWRTAGRYDRNRATVRTYLFTIARTVATDLWRRPSSRPLEPEPSEEALADSDSFEQLVSQLAVREAVDALRPAHREVIKLAHYRGLSQREIAEQLGVPLGTVKTRTFHALRVLRGSLQGLELTA